MSITEVAITDRKAPQDHKRKKQPLRRKLDVILDDDVMLELQARQDEYNTASREYEEWVEGQRQLQLSIISRATGPVQERFIETLPPIPGAEGRQKDLEAKKEALSGAEEALREHTATLWFRSIGRKAYDALIDKHPPTDEHNEQYTKETGNPAPYHLDDFPKALVAISCENLDILDETIDEIWDDWNSAELTEMFTAALLVNTFRRTAQLGNA